MTRPAKAFAAELIVAVQDSDQQTCHRLLSGASRDDLYGAIVCLAASVRQDDPLLAHFQPPMVPVDEIVDAACRVAGCFPSEFRGDGRKTEFVRARAIAGWVGAMAGYSYSELGRKFNQHHTTVMSNVDRVTRDPELHQLAVRVVERIGADRVQASSQKGA
jgi:hypothetical protein